MADEATSPGHEAAPTAPQDLRLLRQRLLANRLRELFRSHSEAPLPARLVALLQGFSETGPVAANASPEAPEGNTSEVPSRAL